MKEEEFKKKLTPEQYRVMRQKGAEKPFTGKYWDNEEDGTYACAACGSELFSSEDKFDSETGFPSFKKSLDNKKIELITDPDSSDRLDVRCKNCSSHLGYAMDGEEKYYRLNSASLELKEHDEDDEEDDDDEDEESGKKSDKSRKLREMTKQAAMLTATAVMSAVVGAAAGFTICQNSKPTPPPAPTTAINATKPKTAPAPTAATLPRSITPPPPTPAPVPPAGNSAAGAIGTPPPSSAGTTP